MGVAGDGTSRVVEVSIVSLVSCEDTEGVKYGSGLIVGVAVSDDVKVSLGEETTDVGGTSTEVSSVDGSSEGVSAEVVTGDGASEITVLSTDSIELETVVSTIGGTIAGSELVTVVGSAGGIDDSIGGIELTTPGVSTDDSVDKVGGTSDGVMVVGSEIVTTGVSEDVTTRGELCVTKVDSAGGSSGEGVE